MQLVAGATQDRAQAGAGQEEGAGDRQQDAEDRGAGRAEPERDERLEGVSERAAVPGAERQHQAGERDGEPELERADVDERALGDHQRAERHEDDRREVRGRAEPALHEIADRAAAEPEPEHGREKDADRAEGEPDQLRMWWAWRRGPRFLPPRRFLTRLGVFGDVL